VEIACSCKSYYSAHIIDHHGALLVQSGAFIDLQ
jgi:hypothetical protein